MSFGTAKLFVFQVGIVYRLLNGEDFVVGYIECEAQSFKGAPVSFMAKADTLEHVKRNSIPVRGGAGIEDELRFCIDEARDEPGRCDPVDPRARASDPGPLLILRFGSAASRAQVAL